MKKSVTIHDIAKRAEVSSATVSRVLSKSDYPVSPELRRKIKKVAKEMNYIPNMLGKNLKTKNNKAIGVIIPSITNPFYSSVMLGIEEVARQNDYHVLLCNSLQDPEIEEEYLKMLVENQVKGIVISSISGNPKLLEDVMNMGLNVVAIDQQIDVENVYQIGFDYRKGGYMATKYLIDRGHRRIAYVTAPLDRHSRKRIYEGYLDAMEEAGIKIDSHLIQEGKVEKELYSNVYEFDNGKTLTRRLLSETELPTAIFACNDMTAFGVINELASHEITVPGHISVIGFDNIELAEMITPSLTTIKQPDYDTGILAGNMLVDILKGGKTRGMDVVLQPRVVERQSVEEIKEKPKMT